MPELPEVETVCVGLSKKLLDLTVKDIKIINGKLRWPIPKNIKKKLQFKKVKSIIRRGKYGLIIFDGNYILTFHLGMTGQFNFLSSDFKPKKHDHFLLQFSDGTKLVYNDTRKFGFINIINKPLDLFKFKFLGIEPQLINLFKDILYFEIKKKSKDLKSILLDQTFICGIGNIYASEILFHSKLSPFRKGRKVKKCEFLVLLNSIDKILKKAIEKGGSTIKDYINANNTLGYFQTEFKVYNRDGLQCYNCKNIIIKTRQNGRSSFYCNTCQAI